MLSDEERKAIENLKIEYEKLIKEDNILFPLYKSDAKRLIDIIEKQSKEIEELKDTRSVFNMGRRSYKNEIEDKIKAKIEEIDMTGEIGYLVKGILQSLLEKRSKNNE